MINDHECITTELKKVLEKMIILSSNRLNNLVAMIVGIIVSQSVILSDISQKLKDSYSSGTEESKIKRLQRFFRNKLINPEKVMNFLHISYFKIIKTDQIKFILSLIIQPLMIGLLFYNSL